MNNIVIKALPDSVNLLQPSIGELETLLTEGTISSVDLVSGYLGTYRTDRNADISEYRER